eukprot:71848-Chlamydomonas_euryale.AAC.1
MAPTTGSAQEDAAGGLRQIKEQSAASLKYEKLLEFGDVKHERVLISEQRHMCRSSSYSTKSSAGRMTCRLPRRIRSHFLSRSSHFYKGAGRGWARSDKTAGGPASVAPLDKKGTLRLVDGPWKNRFVRRLMDSNPYPKNPKNPYHCHTDAG